MNRYFYRDYNNGSNYLGTYSIFWNILRQTSEAVNFYIGVQKNYLACNMPKKTPNQDTTDQVEQFFEENEGSSLRDAQKETGIPRATVLYSIV